MSRRFCVFSIDDSFRFIDEEKIYLLNALKNISDHIMIISCTSYEDSEMKKLAAITDDIHTNIAGYDANRWKYGIGIMTEQNSIKEIDELLLVNDSCFGPFSPLEEVFAYMKQKKVDFWGMTVHGKIPRKTTLFQRKCSWNRFLQTYFLCFNKRVLDSDLFRNFWDQIPLLNNFKEYEEKFEFKLTEYFGKKFSWMAYADTLDWESDDAQKFMSFILFQPLEMIREKGFPFLSKYAVMLDKATVLQIQLGEQITDTLSYIANHTNYDTEMIYKFLIRRNNLYDLKKCLNLSMILPDTCELESGAVEKVVQNRKIAIFAHLFYEDLFDYCLSYLIPLSDFCDIYITTGSEISKKILETKIGKNEHIKEIRVCSYRGREWAAFLLIDKEYISLYEYCCIIHDKKSSQMFYATVGKSFCDDLWENSLKSVQYVKNMIYMFEKNRHIGLLVPPEVYHGTYFHTAIDFWTVCFDGTKKFLEENDIYVPLDRQKPPVSVGSVYWCRREALEDLLRLHITEEDFPPEPMPVDGSFNHFLERALPYMAQNRGYYTCIAMTPKYAGIHIENYQEIVRVILKHLKEKKLDLTTFGSAVNSIVKMKFPK